jgi:hypothetical protein
MLVIPWGGRPLGDIQSCQQKVVSGEAGYPGLFDMSCMDACLSNPTVTSRHFLHEYNSHRCLNLSLSSKAVHQEVSHVFYSHNTFEFHNMADMLRFLHLSTPNYAACIKNVSVILHGLCQSNKIINSRPPQPFSFSRELYSTTHFVEALDLLRRCSNLSNLKAGFEYRVLREWVAKRLDEWLADKSTDILCSVRQELYGPGTEDALWTYEFSLSDGASIPRGLCAKDLKRLSTLKRNDLAVMHDKYMPDFEYYLQRGDDWDDLLQESQFRFTRMLVLSRCFRMYKTWTRSEYCLWTEWPRSDPPVRVEQDHECLEARKISPGCWTHMHRCLEPTGRHWPGHFEKFGERRLQKNFADGKYEDDSGNRGEKLALNNQTYIYLLRQHFELP